LLKGQASAKAWRAKLQVYGIKMKGVLAGRTTGAMTAELPKKVNPVKAGGAKLWACTLFNRGDGCQTSEGCIFFFNKMKCGCGEPHPHFILLI
jgi:hypothetical protein